MDHFSIFGLFLVRSGIVLGPFWDRSGTILGTYCGRCWAILGPYCDHTGTIKGPSWEHYFCFLQADCSQSATAKMADFFKDFKQHLSCEKFVVLCFDDFFFFVFYRQNARGSSTHWQLPKGNTRQKWQNLSERKRKSRRKTYACKEDFNWKWKGKKPSVGKLN